MRLAALASILVLTGCSKAQPTQPYEVRIERVQQEIRHTDRLDVERAEAIVLAEIAEGPSFTDELTGNELAAEVSFADPRDHFGVIELVLHVNIAAPPELRERLPNGLKATVALSREDGTMELERDLPVAADRLVGVLEAKLDLLGDRKQGVMDLLGSEDPELVLLALDWVREHHSPEFGDAVAALVDHRDDRVSLLAVECLGSVGTSSHASRLVRAARLADRAHANRVYEALASLGGEQARGFLEFAARNEDDPELAAAAKHALEQLVTGRGVGPERTVRRGHRR